MEDFLDEYVVPAFALLYVVYAVWSIRGDARFRRKAIRVEGTMRHVDSDRNGKTCFVEYEHAGQKRIARYTSGMLDPYEVGDSVPILINPRKPPNERLPGDPDKTRRAPPRMCLRADAPLVSVGEAAFLAGAVLLLGYLAWGYFEY